jgi:hypothetical protein
MLKDFNKYRFVEKSKSEIEADRIVNDINNKLWNNNGYMTIYNLGAINQLKVIAQALDKYGHLERNDVLRLISYYKESEGVSDLIDMILEEFDYKENNK